MKILIAAFLIIVGISAAYAAGGFMLLHVGDANGNGGAPPSSCDGSIDLSTGCVQPMLR
jgi:hypothetical protein